MDRDRLKKALMIMKRRSISCDVEEMVFRSMGRTMNSLVALQEAAGFSFCGEVDFGEGRKISFEREPWKSDWKKRFVDIATMAQSIAVEVDMPVQNILRQMLDADGWVLNERTLKTPPWMRIFMEIAVRDLPKEFGDFEWLKSFT